MAFLHQGLDRPPRWRKGTLSGPLQSSPHAKGRQVVHAFQSFDSENEKATVTVFAVISRHENVSDMPEVTLREVLANQVLRGRLMDSDASNDEISNS